MFKRAALLTLFLMLLPLASSAQDALFVNTDGNVGLGATNPVTVSASFASMVLGGEIRVEYDPTVLFLERIDWRLGYVDDPELRCPPETVLPGGRGCPGDRAFLAMGSLAGLPDGPVADLVFRGIGVGTSAVRLVEVSPFSDTTGGTVNVSLGETFMTVPEPGLALGLLIGVGALAGAGRREGRRSARGARPPTGRRA